MTVIGALTLLLSVAPSAELELPAKGMRLEDVQSRWPRGRRLDVSAPQGFRSGLVDTELLSELNRHRWAPKRREGRFDVRPLSTFWVGSGFVFAFDRRGALSFAMLRYRVPVDFSADPKGGWSSERLAARRRVVAELTPQLLLAPAKRDRYGNVFRWSGRRNDGTQARLRYLPTSDELRLLLRF